MSTLSTDTRGLQTRWPTTHDHHPPASGAFLDQLRNGGFPPCRRIVQAERLYPGRAVSGSDARPDLILLPGQQFAHDVRIGDVGARHPDQVGVTGRQGMPGRRQVGDPPGVEDRHADLLAERASDIEMLAERPPERRNDARQFPVCVGSPVDHREEVDQSRTAQRGGDFDAFLVRQGAFHALVTRDAHANDEGRTDLFPYVFQHVDGESHAVAQTSSVTVLALIGPRCPELVDQVAGHRRELHTVQPATLGSLHRLAVGPDDPPDIEFLDRLRIAAVRPLPDRRRPERRQPVADVPARTPAQVRQLDHHRGAVRVHPLRDVAVERQYPVVPGVDLIEYVGRIHRNVARTADDRESYSTLCLFLVIQHISGSRLPVDQITGRCMSGAVHAILQRQGVDDQRLQHGVDAHGNSWGRRVSDGACRMGG